MAKHGSITKPEGWWRVSAARDLMPPPGAGGKFIRWVERSRRDGAKPPPRLPRLREPIRAIDPLENARAPSGCEAAYCLWSSLVGNALRSDPALILQVKPALGDGSDRQPSESMRDDIARDVHEYGVYDMLLHEERTRHEAERNPALAPMLARRGPSRAWDWFDDLENRQQADGKTFEGIVDLLPFEIVDFMEAARFHARLEADIRWGCDRSKAPPCWHPLLHGYLHSLVTHDEHGKLKPETLARNEILQKSLPR